MSAAAPASLYEARVEALIGRPLRQAERAIDVLRLDQAMNDAKDALHQAIEDEKRRAIRTRVLRSGKLELRLTRSMLRPLELLFRLGREEAYLELRRLGYEPRRAYAADPSYDELGEIARFIEMDLHNLAVRVEAEYTDAGLGGASRAAIAQALFDIPGARNLASLVVSGALMAGMATTFDANSDLVECWQYTALLDAGTCEICAPLDGTEYHSLEELFRVLPNFGPNPRCLGGSRCRCRAVPCPKDEVAHLPSREPQELHPERFPGSERATVAPGKLGDYLLNADHPDNRGKARLFETLGYTKANEAELEALFLREVPRVAGISGRDVPGGQTWRADIEIEGPTETRRIRTVWFVPATGDAPHFVTAYRATRTRRRRSS